MIPCGRLIPGAGRATNAAAEWLQHGGDGVPPRAMPDRKLDILTVAAPILAAALWLVMALTHPATTYHFAPTVAAAIGAVIRRLRTRHRSSWPTAILDAAVGSGASVATFIILLDGHALRGPTLIDTAQAPLEAVLAITLGAMLALLLGRATVQCADGRSVGPGRSARAAGRRRLVRSDIPDNVWRVADDLPLPRRH